MRRLVALGGRLRRLHLMDTTEIGAPITRFEGDGDFTVDKPRFDNGRVYINNAQYFCGVPETAWAFYIGGYQPAQKWLKDRKGRGLEFADIQHYMNIVKILDETRKVMDEIG